MPSNRSSRRRKVSRRPVACNPPIRDLPPVLPTERYAICSNDYGCTQWNGIPFTGVQSPGIWIGDLIIGTGHLIVELHDLGGNNWQIEFQCHGGAHYEMITTSPTPGAPFHVHGDTDHQNVNLCGCNAALHPQWHIDIYGGPPA